MFASRRAFLKQMASAPVLFVPASLRSPLFPSIFASGTCPATVPSFAESLNPHYPSKSPLDDVLRRVVPGSDEYVLEGPVAAIQSRLRDWGRLLKTAVPGAEALSQWVDRSVEATAVAQVQETDLRPGDPLQAIRREFGSSTVAGRDRFLDALGSYFSSLPQIETADFEIFGGSAIRQAPPTLDLKVRYEFVGTRQDHAREQRIGHWRMQWYRDSLGAWKVSRWDFLEEELCRSARPIFLDVTSNALGQTRSYESHLARGSDYWRTVLDGAAGLDVYGNNGLAVGDFDNDGLDDLYVCQPAGLPNRLYRNRGDGTFEDVTEASGVGVLDFTACALFADFQNRGRQDLLVVCATGPLLFLNDGRGAFTLRRDAFQFARPPQGAFTHAAAADYDRDGRLDVYFCLYNYYQGLDQYRYPVPYVDARNGPPNYLFHNEGGGIFRDRTEDAGLNVENDRYTFACCWGDITGDAGPDLYVVNDFGRNSLYRNRGDGTFTAISGQARVNDVGAGMSACWLDFDNDGRQDLYAAGMWVADGMRVMDDPRFHAGESEALRSLYRRHATGNSLYRNGGDGTFENIARPAGIEVGRWSWSTDSWDFDHDGYPDLYVANGYITGASDGDASSFFWRQVVSRSPSDASPSPAYEQGWGAINELIRSDSSWNGRERNVLFANNRNGTFSDVSGLTGIDFRDDSRSFVLSDLDGDGRLEVVLKNRNAPQLRILRNAMPDIGHSIVVRLEGVKSNRDAIGAAVTLQSGTTRQTKYVQAGSGFLSQHTKELFFGVGKRSDPVQVIVRWPSALTQRFDALPVNSRIQIREGSADFRVTPFPPSPQSWDQPGRPSEAETLPTEVATWLIEPVKAPDFSLPDLAGNLRTLQSFSGSPLLLTFWTGDSRPCLEQLQSQQTVLSRLAAQDLRLAAMNVDDPSEARTLKSLAERENLTVPVLLADPDTAALYNLVYRYLFSRHRDLPLPSSFLLDESGSIVAVYQGKTSPERIRGDVTSMPRTPEDRLRKALPFPGVLVQDALQRNSFTYGVACFQNGFLEEAALAFQRVISEKPADPEAYYNLGTVSLRRNALPDAQRYLEQAVKLKPNYPEAWNNLGMIAAQRGDDDQAIRNFERSLDLRPSYATALLNLGNVYRRQGNLDQAQTLLERARANEPENPEVNYDLGMISARRNQTDQAVRYLSDAIRLRPQYPDALNNLGVVFIQTRQYSEARSKFEECIRQAPEFDQAYLNLARLEVMLGNKDEARRVLQDLLRQQPDHKMARQMLEMLY